MTTVVLPNFPRPIIVTDVVAARLQAKVPATTIDSGGKNCEDVSIKSIPGGS